jgi:hypothetical protein
MIVWHPRADSPHGNAEVVLLARGLCAQVWLRNFQLFTRLHWLVHVVYFKLLEFVIGHHTLILESVGHLYCIVLGVWDSVRLLAHSDRYLLLKLLNFLDFKIIFILLPIKQRHPKPTESSRRLRSFQVGIRCYSEGRLHLPLLIESSLNNSLFSDR